MLPVLSETKSHELSDIRITKVQGVKVHGFTISSLSDIRITKVQGVKVHGYTISSLSDIRLTKVQGAKVHGCTNSSVTLLALPKKCSTVKPVLSTHSKEDQKLAFNTVYISMKVKVLQNASREFF